MEAIGYYKFVTLSDDLKKGNNIKVGATIPRFDCVEFAGDYLGLTTFQNKKGMMILYLGDSKDKFKANNSRLSANYLYYSKFNFSSLYNEIKDNDCIYYGYPNAKPKLKDGSINPLFPFRNDLYLIIRNKQFTEFEILVFKDARGFASHYLELFNNGVFDDLLEELRSSRETFYNYQDAI